MAAIFYELDASGQRNHFDLQPDFVVIAGVAAISVGAGLLLAWAPAVRSIRLGAALSLMRPASSTASPQRLTRWLLGGQVAVALALVTLAALFWSSSRQFVAGGHFDPRHVALLRAEPAYPVERNKDFAREVRQRLETLPGVVAVSMWDRGSPLDGAPVVVSRAQDRAGGLAPVSATTEAIAPRYFAVLGTPLLRGRDFSALDAVLSPPAAIVDESLAHRLWPGRDPIGSVLSLDGGPPRAVIGVVADVSASVRGRARVPRVYTPYSQIAGEANARYIVRVDGDPAAALPTLVRAVNQMDPDVPVTETLPMTTLLAATDELRAIRLTATVAAYAAALAVLLTAIGIFGVLSFAVTRRTREFGLRIAVGAAPRDVMRLIIGQEMTTVLAGAAAGVALTWGVSQLVRHLLYGPGSDDSWLYAAAALVVVGVGAAACWIPTRRASRLDPMAALKWD